jgi:cysteine/glycine-rich protein
VCPKIGFRVGVMSLGGSNNKCPRCSKAVYFVEQVVGPGGMYHKSCLNCKECRKLLDSTNLTDKDNEAYCKNCYGRLFGPKGYGYGGTLSTETKITAIIPSNAQDESLEKPAPQSQPKPAAAQIPKVTPNPSPGSKSCGRCTKTVYYVEQIVGPGGILYHKNCYTCKVCYSNVEMQQASGFNEYH